MKMKHMLAGLAVAVGVCLTAFPTQAGETTVGGKMYGNFSYKSVKEADGNKLDGTGTGYDGKRFYITVSHVVDEVWSLNFTTDIGDQNGAYDVYAKKAYVQAKLRNAPVTFRAGSSDLPWIPAVENLYGFRYVENVLIDRLKFGTSADWGMHVMGKTSDGRINFQASTINGGGYKHPARSKSVDFAGRIGATPVDGLDVAVGGYVGRLGQEMETTAFSQNASRFDAVAAYTKSGQAVETRDHRPEGQGPGLLGLGVRRGGVGLDPVWPLRLGEAEQGLGPGLRGPVLQRRHSVRGRQGRGRVAGLQVREEAEEHDRREQRQGG